MAAVAGHRAALYVSGTGTSFTGEAFTTITANTVYQITSTTKRVWDRSASITVKKDGVTQASTLYTLNRLTGTITFLSDIGGGHTITADGTYLPISQAAQAKTYSYSLNADTPDTSKFGDTYRNRIQGLKDLSGSMSGWKIDTYFTSALATGAPVVLEFWSDTSGSFDYRAWALLNQQQVEDAVAGAIEERVNFSGAADVDGRIVSS